jgi:DNA (cytosine-5)-methyltransferase 1
MLGGVAVSKPPVILDLFCGAGGCTKGYQDAGFQVVGVDVNPQPNYCGDTFIQADALEMATALAKDGALFCGPGLTILMPDAVHASPPCPRYSTITPSNARGRHPDLIARIRELLIAAGLPYVIENVVGSPLHDPVRLCGSSFGLNLRRHRLFESNFPIKPLSCDHSWQTPRFQSLDKRMADRGQLATVVGVHGNCNYSGEFALRQAAMGIDWMTNAELVQAIPPAYIHYIGGYLTAAL